jgi:hypothetical protein
MSEGDPGKLWPTYALRAWLAALLAQTRRLGERLEKRIGLHEQMIARAREQLERSHTVIRSLEEALSLVDGSLRSHRDSEIMEAHARATDAAHEAASGASGIGEARGDQPEREAGEPQTGRNPRRRDR